MFYFIVGIGRRIDRLNLHNEFQFHRDVEALKIIVSYNYDIILYYSSLKTFPSIVEFKSDPKYLCYDYVSIRVSLCNIFALRFDEKIREKRFDQLKALSTSFPTIFLFFFKCCKKADQMLVVLSR